MCEKKEKAPEDFLLDLVTSDMNLARAFAAVSRSAYQLGKLKEGDFARLKAIQLYSEAARLAPQLSDGVRETVACELQVLSTAINWLFAQPASQTQCSAVENHLSLDPPPIAFEEG